MERGWVYVLGGDGEAPTEKAPGAPVHQLRFHVSEEWLAREDGASG